MSNEHNIIIGARNEQTNELDPVVTIRDNQEPNGSVILLMPGLKQADIEQLVNEMAQQGLVTLHEENGEKFFRVTEKGRQMAEEAKQSMLEDEAHG